MRVIDKPIDMVVVTDTEGKMTPIRFKISGNDGEDHVYKIEKVLTVDKSKTEIFYRCIIVINNAQKECRIHYNMGNMRWKLYQI